MEQLFRERDTPNQRRLVQALCLISLSVAILLQVIFNINDNVQTDLLVATRAGAILSLVFLLVTSWRRMSYHYLDIGVLAFAVFIVWQSTLLTELADPDQLSLLARNIGIVAFASLLLPTRFLAGVAIVALQSLICLSQILTFFHLTLIEQLSMSAVVIMLFLAGTFTRWQREISNRHRFRILRQRNNYLDQLAESEAKLRLVTDSLPIFITYVDKNLRLQYVNETGKEWYKLHDVEVIGRSLSELMTDDFKVMSPYAEAALRGEVVHFERVAPYPDGKTRTVDVTFLPHITATGEVLGYFGQVIDLTNVKRSEFDLNNARREAEAANQSKSEFMANMSHELRTPLNAVIGFSSAMAAGMAGEMQDKQIQYVRDIQNSGEHLLSLINDLLDLSKIEAGKLQVDLEQVTVDEQIERCLPFVMEQAKQGQVRLHHIPDPDLPELSVDPRILRQMVVNLLSNAVKFSPEKGSVRVFASQDRNGCLTINVSDEGPGMPAEDIPKALTPFVQTESGLRAGEGTGLGLPLVKQMMILHDGNVEIQSIVGQGTVASLCFPATASAA